LRGIRQQAATSKAAVAQAAAWRQNKRVGALAAQARRANKRRDG
jgi:hypothetical protein